MMHIFSSANGSDDRQAAADEPAGDPDGENQQKAAGILLELAHKEN